MKSISVKELFDFYYGTLNRCNFNLRSKSNDEIEYQIFEEFDIEIITFFHEDSLNRLLQANLISEEVFKLSTSLRKQVLKLQDEGEWDIEHFKVSNRWTDIMNTIEKIKHILELVSN